MTKQRFFWHHTPGRRRWRHIPTGRFTTSWRGGCPTADPFHEGLQRHSQGMEMCTSIGICDNHFSPQHHRRSQGGPFLNAFHSTASLEPPNCLLVDGQVRPHTAFPSAPAFLREVRVYGTWEVGEMSVRSGSFFRAVGLVELAPTDSGLTSIRTFLFFR